ncbi:MAG TPA: hypothetical protein VFA11_13870 [Acidimicrobiales bacterium]|nr:hypothetical protein [Acidimicrobiales bacterium]
MNDPRRLYPTRPVLDDDSARVLEEALNTLTVLRSPMFVGDACAELHAMVSLRAQIDAWIDDTVAAARDQGTTWTVIGRQLGLPASEVRSLYRSRRAEGRWARVLDRSTPVTRSAGAAGSLPWRPRITGISTDHPLGSPA